MEGSLCSECHATGGSAQASPPRAAAKHVARVERIRLLFREVNLCHLPTCREGCPACRRDQLVPPATLISYDLRDLTLCIAAESENATHP
jgi:hypothetical protein